MSISLYFGIETDNGVEPPKGVSINNASFHLSIHSSIGSAIKTECQLTELCDHAQFADVYDTLSNIEVDAHSKGVVDATGFSVWLSNAAEHGATIVYIA